MKAVVQIVGDWDNESRTYAICLIASEKEVDESGIKDGDQVEVTIRREVGE
jgi:hypothetical protein